MRSALPLVRLGFPLVAAAALAACSGGGAGPATPRAVPSAASSGGSSQQNAQRLKVSLVIHSAKRGSSSNRRGREFVSPSTVGVILVVTDSTANTVQTLGYDVSPQPDANSSCGPTDPTTGARTCGLGIPIPAGDTISIVATAYDAVPTLGAGATDSGHALSTGTSGNVTIQSGASNQIAITLDGIADGIETYYYGTPDTANFQQLAVVSLHAIDADGNPIDSYDTTDPFTDTLSVAVTDNGDTSGCSTKCMSFSSVAGGQKTTTTFSSPGTEAIQLFYNVSGGTETDGTGTETGGTPPYYAKIVTSPNPSPASPENGTAYIVPLFAYPTSLTLNSANGLTQSIAADQFHAPTGSTGYTVDVSKCADIASTTGSSAASYGENFSIHAITNGSCNLTLGDGAGDTVGAPLAVTGLTTSPVTLASGQTTAGGSKGAAVNSVTATLPSTPTTGDTLVLIVAQGTTTPANGTVATPAGFTSLANAESISNTLGYAVFVKDVTSSADKSAAVAFPAGTTGTLSYFMGEYKNTAAALATAPSVKNGQAAIGAMGSTTNADTPDAPNAYIFTAASSTLSGEGLGGATDPYTASGGYAEYFSGGASSTTASTVGASLDVQTEPLPAAAATTNTFTASATGNISGDTSNTSPDTTNLIFYLRAKS